MIEVRIPKEITDYEEKIFLGLSIRKLICFGIAIATSFALFFLLKGIFSLIIVGRIVMVINIPIIAVGFLKKNGFTMEKWIPIVLKQKINNHKLTYITDLNDECYNEKEENCKNATKKQSIPEWQGYYVTNKKEQKRKRKITSSKIKAARKESRTEGNRI